MLIGDSEDVNEGCERVDGCERREVQPEFVDEGGEAVEFAGSLELTVTEGKRDEPTEPDNDECCASSAVAGVALVNKEVLRFASQQELISVVVDLEAGTSNAV